MHKENDRIKEIRKVLKLSQEGFGGAIGLTKSSISNIENGLRNVTDQHIRLLQSQFHVNEDWLRNGTGGMFVQSETFSLDEKAQKNNLSELEIDIIQGYMELDRETRTKFMGWIKGTFDRHAETAATTERNIDAKVESFRRELEAEQKGVILSASDELQRKLG